MSNPLTEAVLTGETARSARLAAGLSLEDVAKAHFIERGVPFNKHLGIQVELLVSGHCILRVPFQDTWVGDPTRPALHGGVMASVVDACSGAATFTKLENVMDRISTVVRIRSAEGVVLRGVVLRWVVLRWTR